MWVMAGNQLLGGISGASGGEPATALRFAILHPLVEVVHVAPHLPLEALIPRVA
jgi:hypothetical protein